MDEDDHISVREVVKCVLDLLTLLDVNLPATTLDNIYVYITMLETSVKTLLAKYVITDVAQSKYKKCENLISIFSHFKHIQVDGRVVPDLNNQKFVDQRINIKEVVPSIKITFSGSSFSKYLKSATSSTKIEIEFCEILSIYFLLKRCTTKEIDH